MLAIKVFYMNVLILNVLRKGSVDFPSGKQFLFNAAALGNPTPGLTNQTRIPFTPDLRWQGNSEMLIVDGDYQSIQNSLGGTSDVSATITITPAKVNGVTNTQPRTVRISDIGYGVADGSNILLFVSRAGRVDPEKWQINSTTLEAYMTVLNQATANINFTGTFGACATSTQAFTYSVNQAVTLVLQVFNGSVWADVDTKSVSAGSSSTTFSFSAGDLVSGDAMQVTALYGSNYVGVAQGTFQCTGGSASGSGTSGDCNMYAYFDGEQWSNETDTLNWGATCTTGYHLQVSTSSNFTDTSSIVVDIETTVTILPLEELANGTYYARVANVSGATRYSPTLTFTKS